jgi:group I intron endonuclease
MNNYLVYRHRRLDNFKVFYIGIGSFKRPYSKYSRSTFWRNIVNKTEYYVEIVQQNLSLEDACELEILLISEYGRYDLGLGTLVNLTDGGEGRKGYIPSKETRDKISLKSKGENNPNYGKHMSDLQKIKISKTKIENCSHCGDKNPMYGKKGKLNPNFGKTGVLAANFGKVVSQEQKNLISNSLRRGNCIYAKLVLDTQTGIFFDCLKDAAEAYVINYSTLRSMLQGKNKNKTNLIYC